MDQPTPKPDGSTTEDEVMKERARIAANIRSTRKARGLSTRELGRRAGLSSGTVSMIENSRTGVSLESLRTIAGVLGVPVVEFLAEPEAQWPPLKTVPEIVKLADRRQLAFPGSGVSIQMLTKTAKNAVEFVVIEFEPAYRPAQLRAHNGEEYGLILAGTMHFCYGDEVYVLETGDSIVFDSGTPHGVENRGTEKIVQLSAITPPSY